MKFAIAFFIGDTEIHDKLCEQFGNRTEKVQMLCRHCNCPINWSHIPSKNHNQNRKIFSPSDVNAYNSVDDLKNISYHQIRNVFHAMNFGSNTYNIHLVTPGKKLHMHQLGAAKRALQSFVQRFCPTSNSKLRNVIESLSKKYGAYLNRQLDRNFPRTKFTSGYLSTVKKDGNDYSGLIICLVLALLSSNGVVAMEPKESPSVIKNFICALETIIGMEEFLNIGSMKFKHVELTPRIVANFLNEVNINCYRTKGMGQRLIKNHLYFHLQEYVQLWGTPAAGWDSSPSEGHHKTEIKAPSKSTQCNKSTFISQTAGRQIEYRLIDRAVAEYSLDIMASTRERKQMSGSKYYIYEKCIKWEQKCDSSIPLDVLEFC